MNIIWHPNAVADLAEICEHIALDKPGAAAFVHAHIIAKIQMLAVLPDMGRIGRAPGVRELIPSPYPYIIPYVYTRTEVVILHVLHGSRRRA